MLTAQHKPYVCCWNAQNSCVKASSSRSAHTYHDDHADRNGKLPQPMYITLSPMAAAACLAMITEQLMFITADVILVAMCLIWHVSQHMSSVFRSVSQCVHLHLHGL